VWEARNYINGEFVESKSSSLFEDLNPSTEESLGTFFNSTNAEVDCAYNHARSAFEGWRSLGRVQRAEYLYKVAKLIEERQKYLAEIISWETGKNFNESVAEVNEALHMAQYAFGSGRMPQGEALASEVSEKDSYMLRKPKGVVAVISPWNFPLAIGAFWCAAPALVEGNTVIIKPSEDAPYISQIAAKLYHDAGIPAGVINLIHGDGSVGDYLANKDVDHICFTGSAEVGQHIRRVCADSWHKTCSCEMGSKSAVIVFDDANFDLAVSSALASSFKLSGQRCVSAGRLIIQRGIYDDFCESFSEHVRSSITVGAPFVDGGFMVGRSWSPNTEVYMGPLINAQQLRRVSSFNEKVTADPEAEILIAPLYTTPGYFASPMVYKTEWRDAPYLKKEVFGPHVAIIPFDTIDDAIRIYNDTDYGLAVGVVTEDFKKARICRDRCDYGMCYWNGGSIAAESHVAFGGVKKSGNGYPSAARTFRAVTHEVTWTVNHDEQLTFPQGMK
jgi:aldehyde dehydrogenase (NAD+)